jgi:phage tail-like protein
MMPGPHGPLLNHLPAIYHTSEDLCKLLAVFESVLFGADGKGLTHSIATIASLFDAYKTRTEFVPWLAQWVALTQLSGLCEQRQRELLATIVPLYAQRGTKVYLARLLEFFKPENTTVEIEDRELQGFIVETAKLGLDSRLEHDRPFWFQVRIHTSAPVGDADAQRGWEARLRRVIDLAKPAHTLYELDWQFEESTKQI